MVDSGISHEVEDRLRNIEAHLGIGQVDEETGAYSVKQHEEEADKPDNGPEEPDENQE